MATPNQGTEIVKFNVGGTKYEVSRSLIEGHPHTMLARLVSDTWHENPGQEIFIERDGLRFRCILDYMRDRKAHVPMNTTKASVLQDLEYFGFEGIPDDAIDVSCANLAAATHVVMVEENHEAHVNELAEIHFYEVLAHEGYKRLATKGNLDFFISGADSPRFKSEPKVRIPDREAFNKYLTKYGLTCTSILHYDGSDEIAICLAKLE